ncbi:MAG: hypothetical protein CMG75_00165 [Candidatus Marinimicrobia bacterium]|nr:hypothetical protein [Candidatus Neomarinimicrobiota bacterium]|tara:strand:- start:152 stop:568 length:417 start_codon:yes stop_codon:yes gene_type:complete
MSEVESKKDELLLINVVTMFSQQAWMAMGKLKNPVTDKTERNLQEASFYIDIIDLMNRKMSGNLSGDEQKFLDSSLSGLKINYLEESNKPDSKSDLKEDSSTISKNKDEEIDEKSKDLEQKNEEISNKTDKKEINNSK